MAIYSLHHSVIGRTTQPRVHTASAHIRYVARRKACSRLIGERMPTTSAKAQAWFRAQEDADRKNARVCDKVLLALPRELNATQQAELVRAFAELVTEGRASWLAAFHVTGKDRHNPHCHLVVRDRDPETGKRVCNMSEKDSTQRLRLMWEEQANLALEDAGREERIDRRTLKEQGIQRRPTIHEGLSAREMKDRRKAVRSRAINFRNSPGARSPERRVDYRRFDRGRSRPEYNQYIRETQADYWAALDADRIARQWEGEDRLHAVIEVESSPESEPLATRAQVQKVQDPSHKPTTPNEAFRKKFADYLKERSRKKPARDRSPEFQLDDELVKERGWEPGL